MDVVEYYATYGHGAKVKMFHCVRADLTGTDCPYELAVVPKEIIRGDYYTITASGVVMVRAAGAEGGGGAGVATAAEAGAVPSSSAAVAGDDWYLTTQQL